ncbi:MAG: outer membrane protein assembly factor BamD [Alphaproteobacteria bacterium]|nr:outer membrane protein assembly factor BamD [Alphaproteobacteria bacterium]
MNKIFSLLRLNLIVLSLGILTSCGSSKDEKFEEKSPEDLYTRADKLLEKGENKKAAVAFEEVVRQHPYSKWATSAQIMAAYAYYKGQAFEDALANIDSFLQMHPGSEYVPYAYFLKGLCYYVQVSDTERDQSSTEQALSIFLELIKRFPTSAYSKDARFKIDLLRDYIAGKNMEVGRFYLSQKQYIAALNRFQNTVKNFEGTTHIPEALYRLVETYLILGIVPEAQRTARVLGHNYPDSSWYKEAYQLLENKQMLPSADSSMKITKQWEQQPNAAKHNRL